MSLRIFALVGFILIHSLSAGQVSSDINIMRSRGEDLVIKIVTIGPGDDLTTWWGHTGVVVENKKSDISRFYNYGLYSFEQKNFFTNFAMGRLIFWVGSWDTEAALAYYVSLNREIRIQILDLSPEKLTEIATLLAINILPENREYLYDHYRDNCSTRVRDLLDKVLNGQIYSQTQIPSTMTFRDLTRRCTDQHFMVDWLLMFLMNDSIDKEIRRWDEMFLPEELERNLDELTYKDDSGFTRKLVERHYTYYHAKDRRALPEGVPVHWPMGLVIGFISAGISVVLALGYKRQIKSMRQLFGIFHIMIGIVYGIPGLALFFMSFFTDHVVTYHNENLLLANPFTFLLIIFGIGILVNSSFCIKWSKMLWYFLCGLNMILLVLKIFPAFDQHNWLSIAMIVPLNFAMAYSWNMIMTIKT